MKRIIREYAVVTSKLLYQAAGSLAGVQGYDDVEIRVESSEEGIVVDPKTGEQIVIPVLQVYGRKDGELCWQALDIDEDDLFGQCHLELSHSPLLHPLDYLVYGEPLVERMYEALPRSSDLEIGIVLISEETKED